MVGEQLGAVRANIPAPTKRFAGIVAIYLLIGPPIGGIVVWIELITADIFRDGVSLSGVLPLLVTMVVFSYPIGAPFAFVSGIIHAVAAIWLRHASILVPLFSGCLVGAAASAVAFWTTLNLYSSFWREFGSGLIGLLPVTLIASLVCWRLTRRYGRTA
jgi:hypothetical protein